LRIYAVSKIDDQETSKKTSSQDGNSVNILTAKAISFGAGVTYSSAEADQALP